MIETSYSPFSTLRIKVTDKCPWNCWFCHNEGTGSRNPKLLGDVYWDEQLKISIEKLSFSLPINDIHLTGGEPTENPHLSSLISRLKGLGFLVKMTTRGCSLRTLQSLASSGLDSINFSLPAADDRKTWTDLSEDKLIAQEIQSILLASELKINTKINILIAKNQDTYEAKQTIDWAKEHHISTKIMAELSHLEEGNRIIQKLLTELDAREVRRRYVKGGAPFVDFYLIDDNYEIGFQQVRDFFLPSICDGCKLRFNTCLERFYTLRLEKRFVNSNWIFLVRLCIHRNDPQVLMPVDNFLKSVQLKELATLIMD